MRGFHRPKMWLWCSSDLVVERTVELPMIWDIMTLVLQPCNAKCFYTSNHLVCHFQQCFSVSEDSFCVRYYQGKSLRWRHTGRVSVWNHQPHCCLLNRLSRRRWKKTSKLRVTGLCAGNSPGTGEFPAQMASNAENVSIWLRHHVTRNLFRWRSFFSATMS